MQSKLYGEGVRVDALEKLSKERKDDEDWAQNALRRILGASPSDCEQLVKGLKLDMLEAWTSVQVVPS